LREPVSIHDNELLELQSRDAAIPVHDHEAICRRDAAGGAQGRPTHGLQGLGEDVATIDLAGLGPGHGYGRCLDADHLKEGLPPMGGEEFGVADLVQLGGHDLPETHGTNHQRTGPGTPARLVHAD
jgi:hypothetical protein